MKTDPQTLDEAIEAATGKPATAGGTPLAAALLATHIPDFTPQRLNNWRHRGVPIEHGAIVERTLGISRKILWPDTWQHVWPEMAGEEAAV